MEYLPLSPDNSLALSMKEYDVCWGCFCKNIITVAGVVLYVYKFLSPFMDKVTSLRSHKLSGKS